MIYIDKHFVFSKEVKLLSGFYAELSEHSALYLLKSSSYFIKYLGDNKYRVGRDDNVYKVYS